MSDFDKQVGKRLQMARKHAGKSIVYGGQMIGVAESTMRSYESGQRPISLENLSILSRVYNVDVDYFLGKQKEFRRPTQEDLERFSRGISRLDITQKEKVFRVLNAVFDNVFE